MNLRWKIDLISSLIVFTFFSSLIIFFSTYLIESDLLIGVTFLFLSLTGYLFLKFFNIGFNEIHSDIVFGLIDNGVLVFSVILGSNYGGVLGAIIGGAAGNTITDGLGGIFEGHIFQKTNKKNIFEKKSSMSMMLGKMIGCLIGAGLGFILIHFLNYF